MTSSERSGSTLSPCEDEKDIEVTSRRRTPDHENEGYVAEAAEAEGGEFNGEALEKEATKASVNNISSIPNGGLRAWLQVAGVFCIFFNTWGILNAFGAYQSYYSSGELFTTSPSDISWLGSLQSFLLLLVGTLTGPIYDAGYVYHLLYVGSFLIVFGQMMLSLIHTYWQALLAQAFCIGIGCGCLFVPGVAILSTYFNTRLAFAVGMAASGSSLGGVIYPIVFHRLQPQIGFGWTTRVLGFIMLATLIIPNTVIKVRVLPASKRKLFDAKALTEPAYLLFVLGGLVTFLGLYVPLFYIQYFAVSTKITDDNLGFYLLAILNTASIAGRIIPNMVADKTGPFNMVVPCGIAAGVLIFGLIGHQSVASIVVLSLLYGFFSGTFVSLPPACFVQLSPDRGMIGTRMGMGFAIISIGGLIGTPIAGIILNAHGWTSMWLFAACTAVGGGCLMFVSRMFKSNWRLIAKV